METEKSACAMQEKAQQLNLTETNLILDHAIYSKAVEVVMEEGHSDLRDFINPRMDGFHAICVFLGVIGKLFGDVGLKMLWLRLGSLEKILLINIYHSHNLLLSFMLNSFNQRLYSL